MNLVTTMKPLDLSSILKDLQGKWVALSNDERRPSVYGVGNTAKEAAKAAEAKGNKKFHLLFVRESDFLYSGILSR